MQMQNESRGAQDPFSKILQLQNVGVNKCGPDQLSSGRSLPLEHTAGLSKMRVLLLLLFTLHQTTEGLVGELLWKLGIQQRAVFWSTEGISSPRRVGIQVFVSRTKSLLSRMSICYSVPL